jgi:hypothetical protein
MNDIDAALTMNESRRIVELRVARLQNALVSFKTVVAFAVFTAVSMKMDVFWVVAPCRLV